MGDGARTGGGGAASRRGGWTPAAVVAIGAWSIALLALGPRLGFVLDVPADVEIVDHVIPGAVLLACGFAAWAMLRRGQASESLLYILSTGFTFLAGLWMTATHAPLLVAAARGVVPWGAALWHSWPGPVVVALAVALYLLAAREEGRRKAPSRRS